MAPIEVLFALVLATLVFAYIPGPAVLYIAAQTMSRGRKAGFMAVLGVHLADFVHVLAAAFGLSAIFRHVPELYLAMKLLGAAYLIWLGISFFRRVAPVEVAADVAPRTPMRALADSLAVELLNPKTTIFFVSFLPQFVDPSASLPLWAQFLILGVVVNLLFTSSSILTVLTASYMQAKVAANGAAQRVIRAIGGTILIGLGARIALDRN
ncbi:MULTISPECIES: LysE family translocator [unclassified Bosea (in: a-proteobacteria)]|uniref:LysE family translocator n=1 Tax=unclassified Bosea (in: a-proteobacteria) TaxID=2653178 RepID=UPI000F758EC5|nr:MULTISPECIES: LysE family translocator [unclassified Bosea (in: a-proteobacteria)]AZO76721.1 amino acid transporter [Bosea sp. Tri-49]RXT21554.1 amino acid transporter [Bosea sp. Tri-39]RXT31893.1 amino acid transporter [Bosea sp. Tri-54]